MDFWIGLVIGMSLAYSIPGVPILLYILFWDNCACFPRSGKHWWNRKRRHYKDPGPFGDYRP